MWERHRPIFTRSWNSFHICCWYTVPFRNHSISILKGQSLHFLTPCKIRERVGEISESVFKPSSTLLVHVVDFQYVDRFWNDSASNRLWPKISTPFGPCENQRRRERNVWVTLPVQPRCASWYTFDGQLPERQARRRESCKLHCIATFAGIHNQHLLWFFSGNYEQYLNAIIKLIGIFSVVLYLWTYAKNT